MKHKSLIFFIIAAAVLVYIGVDLYLSNNVLQVTREEVKLSTLPDGFDGYKIVHLSDMHGKSFGENNGSMNKLIAAENPDIICITGDLIDNAAGLSWAREILPYLSAIAPVYYVTGNHEWDADDPAAKQLKQVLTDTGCIWIDNAYTPVERGGDSIIIAGFTDPLGPYDSESPSQIINRINSHFDAPFILGLNHRYNRILQVDLMLSGHAHGGIIRLPFTDGLVGPSRELFPKNTSGLYTNGKTTVAVSRGSGDSYVPRFMNRPQISVLILRSA